MDSHWGYNTLHSESRRLVSSTWSKEELPLELKESAIVPSYKKGN